MAWNGGEIVDAVTDGLLARARADDAAQEVYSIDALNELGLHPLIQQSLRDAGFGVFPEQRYPGGRGRKRKSEGKRCDVVLTPDSRALMEPDVETTLFEPDDAVVLEAAYWLEVKTVSMFTTEGPFSRYSAELLAPVSQDIRKLARDPQIYHSGLLLVLFTSDRPTAEHDLHAWEQRVLTRGYPIASPVIRHEPLNDRLGNANMAVALYPVRRL